MFETWKKLLLYNVNRLVYIYVDIFAHTCLCSINTRIRRRVTRKVERMDMKPSNVSILFYLLKNLNMTKC